MHSQISMPPKIKHQSSKIKWLTIIFYINSKDHLLMRAQQSGADRQIYCLSAPFSNSYTFTTLCWAEKPTTFWWNRLSSTAVSWVQICRAAEDIGPSKLDIWRLDKCSLVIKVLFSDEAADGCSVSDTDTTYLINSPGWCCYDVRSVLLTHFGPIITNNPSQTIRFDYHRLFVHCCGQCTSLNGYFQQDVAACHK